MAALLAPSFPAGFAAPAGQVVGAFKAAGFDYVVEVAQGADLVSAAYREYLEAHPTGLHIATACPAVAEYVRKYHPELTDALVPIVSPMIATALAVKELVRPRGELRLRRAVRGQEGRGARARGCRE